MRRALRWVKRCVLALLALVLVSVIAVLILLHTDWGRDKARTIALAQLQKFFPGGIHVERIDGSVLGDIELHGVTINGVDGKRMIRAGTVKANVKLSALFGKTIELEYARAEDVDVVDPSNPVVVPPDPEPGSWTVELPRIEVRKARVALTGEQPMTFENLEVDASLAVPPLDALVAKASVRGAWKERGFPFTVEAEAKIGLQVEVPKLVATLADTRVDGKDIVIDLARPRATLAIHATPSVVASFAPGFVLPAPADVRLDIATPPGIPLGPSREARIELLATMGKTSVTGTLFGHVDTKQARGMIAAHGVDLQAFAPAITGSGDGVVSVVLDGAAERAHALVMARGQLLDLPAGHAIVDVEASPSGASAMLVAGGKGGVEVATVGRLAREGDRLDLLDARVFATARNAAEATGGQAPFKGMIAAGGRARGQLAPTLGLDLEGYVNAYNLVSTDPKMGGIAIERLAGFADARISSEGTFSHLHATLNHVSRAGSPLGTFEIDARNRRDGKIQTELVAYPAALPDATATLDAVVSLGKTETDPIVIELGEHTLKAPRMAWAGKGGTVTVGEQVEVRGIRSRSGNASIAVEDIVSADGRLAVKLDAKNIAASLIDPAYLGTVSADVDLTRRGITWNGKANVTANGLVLGKDLPAVEGKVALVIANRRVKADVTASTFEVGGVRLVLDVDGPRDITDPRAWRRLERKAIRTALLGVTRIDLGAAKVKTGGVIDGELVLTGMETSGSFAIKAVQTPIGMIEGDINFAPMGDELGVSSTLNVENFGEAEIAAHVVIPRHPFEPLEWKRLGRGVLRILTVNVEDIAIEPAKLAKLGIEAPYSARANLNVLLAAGASEARAKLDLADIRGGRLLKPLALSVEAHVDPKDTSATVQVTGNAKPLATVSAKLPGFGFDRWIAEAPKVKDAPLEGRLEIPDIDVVETLATFGRIDITSGKIGGAITFAGTPLRPTADGELVVTNVNVKPRLAGRKLPTLTELRIKGTWDGETAGVLVTGKESDGATLDITARARPDNLAALTAKVDIRKFDIAPIAVFLPGPLVAATGKIGAKITATGITPDKIRGTLALEKGRVPIHPQVGTIRDTNVSVKLTDLGLAYTIDAKLGAGTIKLKGEGPKDLSKITLHGAVDKLSPIGDIQPIIAATLDGSIARKDGEIHVDLALTKASVDLDLEQGIELLAAEMPEDMYLGRSTPPPPTPKEARIPRKPWFTVNVTLDSTPVFVKQEYVEVRARANANKGIRLAIGRTIGMDGSIEIERGDVNVLGRQYRVDPGPDKIRFDGTIDPLLGIRLTHDFPTLTLSANLTGRVSKKEIHMTGTPEIYTQEELLAFFLGADPGGEASATTRDVASSVGAAILSAKLGRQAKKVLPVKVDVVACDPGTSASGPSCRLGKWLTENWFMQFRQRIEPRPDEPPQEVELQYYFKKNWLIEGAGFTERFGGDVLWRKRW